MASQPPLLGITKDDKKKPGIYKFYDYTKGGTDAMDYRLGINTVKTKSKRWSLSVCAYVLDTIRVNSQTIYAICQGKDPRSTDSINYGWELSMQLTKPHMERRATGGLTSHIQRSIDMMIGPAVRFIQRQPQNPDARRHCDLCVEAL